MSARVMGTAWLAVCLLLMTGGVSPTWTADVAIKPGVDGILTAFDTHPLVGLADQHGMAEEGDFYVAIVSDPRFAERVGNVVVEFGGSAHQATLDAYLAGSPVPYAELRRVWTDVVGWYPTVTATMYLNFFAQVRLANGKLPPERRIKVWLGEPAIDWSKIATRADLKPYQDRRDSFAADLIGREILAPGKKALVIYGLGHFDDFELGPFGVRPSKTLWALVEEKRPGAFFVVRPYAGLPDRGCSRQFEAEVAGWSSGTLATPVKGTWLAHALRRPGCAILRTVPRPPGSPPPVFSAETRRRMERAVINAPLDALLYLGPSASLTESPWDPTFFLDDAYFRELSRRSEIVTGRPLDWKQWVRGAARAPGPFVEE